MADEEHEPTCCERFSAGLSNFFKFLYNNETGQVMGRSGTSWAKIGFFYLIFYGFLAGFFSGMLAVFLSTLNDPTTGPPKLTQYVANQPGLTRLDEYLPGATKLTLKYDKVKTKYDSKVKEDYKKTIDNFLQKYTKGVFAGKPACNAQPLLGKTKDAECQYNTTELGACMATNTSFGLENEAPCIFIRINKVYGWIPKDTANNGYLKLKCSGKGLVAVYPPGGFLINAFPFKGQNRNDFELPVVAVQVNRTTLKQVDCKLEGDDIETSTSYVPSRAYGNIRIK